MNRHSPTATDVDGPPDRKSVLFCPVCEHASPVDGDWVVQERTSGLEHRCPDCDTRITKRGREHEQGSGDGRDDGRPADPTVRMLSAWLRVATAWIRPFRRCRTRG